MLLMNGDFPFLRLRKVAEITCKGHKDSQISRPQRTIEEAKLFDFNGLPRNDCATCHFARRKKRQNRDIYSFYMPQPCFT